MGNAPWPEREILYGVLFPTGASPNAVSCKITIYPFFALTG